MVALAGLCITRLGFLSRNWFGPQLVIALCRCARCMERGEIRGMTEGYDRISVWELCE